MSKISQAKKAAFAEGYAAYKVDKDTHWKPYVKRWLLTEVGREYKRGYDLAKDEMQPNNTLINRFRVLFGMANV
jgi:hypothetical protein